MADLATIKMGHSYGETNDAQKNVFDLGAFVEDLTFEEDASSEDISLEGLQQELEECKSDEWLTILETIEIRNYRKISYGVVTLFDNCRYYLVELRLDVLALESPGS